VEFWFHDQQPAAFFQRLPDLFQICGWMSTAVTRPVAPAMRASGIVKYPKPHPMSRMQSPALINPSSIFSGFCQSLRMGLSKAYFIHHGHMMLCSRSIVCTNTLLLIRDTSKSRDRDIMLVMIANIVRSGNQIKRISVRMVRITFGDLIPENASLFDLFNTLF